MRAKLAEFDVGVDSYRVSPEPVLLTAELDGALALCLHDERRAVGGLLHLRFNGAGGRPSEVTDNTLSAVLVVLDRFKREVLGNASRRGDAHARILAHAPPPADPAEPSATLVDLIRADLADAHVQCGTESFRRCPSLLVRFEPFTGRVWIAGSGEQRGSLPQRRRL